MALLAPLHAVRSLFSIGRRTTAKSPLVVPPQVTVPEWMREGDRVQARPNTGFHRGAHGVVKRIEVKNDTAPRVWVLRDGATNEVWYWPDELEPEG
jgi:hypothetical protein